MVTVDVCADFRVYIWAGDAYRHDQGGSQDQAMPVTREGAGVCLGFAGNDEAGGRSGCAAAGRDPLSDLANSGARVAPSQPSEGVRRRSRA